MHKHILHDMGKCLPKVRLGIVLRYAYKECGCAYVLKKYIVAGRGAADEKLRARETGVQVMRYEIVDCNSSIQVVVHSGQHIV